MKKLIKISIVILCSILCLQCTDKTTKVSYEIVMNRPNVNIPSSERSKKVIKKQTPILKEALAEKGLQLGAPIFMRILKAEEVLEMWVKKGDEFKLFKSYPVCYYSGGLGSKKKQGDQKSPEGFYYVKPSQLNPNSLFHLSFNIGYPNAYDRAQQYTGSAIMVHGNCVSVGCYAMTNELIDEIYTMSHHAFRGDQDFFRIHIFPFHMTDENMSEHENSEWYSFWKNLQEGYLIFEKHKNPPNVLVKNKRYYFEEPKH